MSVVVSKKLGNEKKNGNNNGSKGIFNRIREKIIKESKE